MITLTMPNIPCRFCGKILNRFAVVPEYADFILTRNKCHHCDNVVEIPIWRVK